MVKNRILRVAVLAAMVMAVVPSFAQANTIGLLSMPTTTPISSTLTDWTETLAFPQFDPLLGMLTSVQLTISGGISTLVTVTNQGGGVSRGRTYTNWNLTVQDAGGNLTDLGQLNLNSPLFNYSNLNAGNSVTSGILTAMGTDTESYTLPAVLAEFTGSGSIALAASTDTLTALRSTGGNTCASQYTHGFATGQVLYTYNPVPEPSMFSLLVVGAIGLFGYAWRLRKPISP